MDADLIKALSVVTEEEQELLSGKTDIDRQRYMDSRAMVIDSRKMLQHGKLISIRPHTRFVHFPRHRHNYVELIYMCQGQTTHMVDGRQVVLKEGELLFLNQHAWQEILPAGEKDIAVNFIILPEFFDTAFQMVGEEDSLLREFMVSTLKSGNGYENYLHFKVAGILPVQNLVENLVWTLLYDQPNKRSMNQITMGLLMLQLTHYTGCLSAEGGSMERELTLRVLRYIDENYRNGELTELAGLLGYDVYWLSRAIKRLTGHNYKELLQMKRLSQAVFLLLHTGLSVADISVAVGYDNTSYFHRIFRAVYGVSPGEYRKNRRGTGS